MPLTRCNNQPGTVTDNFYVSIRATEANPGGEIHEIDPQTLEITNVISLASCRPTGIAFGPAQNLFVECSRGQIPTYGYGYSVVLDMASNGSIVGNISGLSGLGQVIHELSLNLYYAAAYRDLAITPGELRPGQERYSPMPRVTIIDASDHTVIQSIRKENITSHTVAVDPKTRQMVMPIKKEGIAVYNIDNNSTLPSRRTARELYGDGEEVCFFGVDGGVVVWDFDCVVCGNDVFVIVYYEHKQACIGRTLFNNSVSLGETVKQIIP